MKGVWGDLDVRRAVVNVYIIRKSIDPPTLGICVAQSLAQSLSQAPDADALIRYIGLPLDVSSMRMVESVI